MDTSNQPIRAFQVLDSTCQTIVTFHAEYKTL